MANEDSQHSLNHEKEHVKIIIINYNYQQYYQVSELQAKRAQIRCIFLKMPKISEANQVLFIIISQLTTFLPTTHEY